MNSKQKITNISKAERNITNIIETVGFKSSELLGLLTIEISAMDLGIDGSIDIFHKNPIAYTTVLLSPIVIGYLIKRLDPNSEIANEINEIIEEFKPKSKVIKK